MNRRYNLITTPWLEHCHDKKKAHIYCTNGGRVAVQIVAGFGGCNGFTSAREPRYYKTAAGAFAALESAGFGGVVTLCRGFENVEH
jgi:hypothetical protein